MLAVILSSGSRRCLCLHEPRSRSGAQWQRFLVIFFHTGWSMACAIRFPSSSRSIACGLWKFSQRCSLFSPLAWFCGHQQFLFLCLKPRWDKKIEQNHFWTYFEGVVSLGFESTITEVPWLQGNELAIPNRFLSPRTHSQVRGKGLAWLCFVEHL